MGFSDNVKDRAFAACARHCCICHKYCGTKMQLHHIKQKADGGEDTFDNAIPLCLNCHADMGRADPKHVLGRHFTEDELKMHRDNWYEKQQIQRAPHAYLLCSSEHIRHNIYYSRSGSVISIYGEFTIVEDVSNYINIGMLPSGFRPETTQQRLAFSKISGSPKSIQIRNDGLIIGTQMSKHRHEKDFLIDISFSIDQ